MEMYLEDSFKNYVEEKYSVTDQSLFTNNSVLQMIYALEWYDVPRSAKADMVEFHPYLTQLDYEKLYYIKNQHITELAVSSLLFYLTSNRILNNNGPTIFRKRYVRFPSAIIVGSLLTYGLNQIFLKTLLSNDLKEEKLDKYYILDLNAEMMKEDLSEMGIKIKAAHFDMDATQKRIDDASKKV